MPIFNVCGEVRCKMGRTYQGWYHASRLPASDNQDVLLAQKTQSKQLKNFQIKKGPLPGNTSGVNYRGCVFEKLRIRDRMPKTKLRWETEGAWAYYGASIEHERTHTYVV